MALKIAGTLLLIVGCFVRPLSGQVATATHTGPVPPIVTFSGSLTDENAKPLTGTVAVTFSLYQQAQGGTPLWIETQNVYPAQNGSYTVFLGSTNNTGIPSQVFASGEARWLGILVQGQQEQSRIPLVSVGYAMKAADAETLAGLPAAAFVRAATATTSIEEFSPLLNTTSAVNSVPQSLAGSGTTNYIPLWKDNNGTLGNSVVFQSATTPPKIGINTALPASSLDVNGGGTIRGTLSLPASGTATVAKGYNSQPMRLASSVFDSGTSSAVAQIFQWQAKPLNNNTAKATGSLNLLFAKGTGVMTETGLKIAPNGVITFAPSQSFPGAVTSVGLTAPANDFAVTGSPVTGAGTLALKWGSNPPTSANMSNAIIRRDATGSVNVTNVNATRLFAAAGISAMTIDPDPKAVGVYTVSMSGTGISASSDHGTAGIFSNYVATETVTIADGNLITGKSVYGDVFKVAEDGTVTASGPVIGASGSAIPLAFASVSSTGSLQSGSSNLTVQYNSTTGRYEITIAGVTFDRTKYTTVATPSGWSNVMSFLNTDGVNGKLIVDARDVNGKLHQADFQVVVFQAH